MNEEHERALRQLRETAKEGVESEAFYQVLRKVTEFGPVPREVMQEILEKRATAAGVRDKTPQFSPEEEQRLRKALACHHEPSQRAKDPNHPVGAVADAIRAALPEFRPWQVDMSTVDLNRAAGQLREDRARALSYLRPPDFADKQPASYLTAERDVLVKDADGSVLTIGELMQRKATREACTAQMKEGARFSDVLRLSWKRLEPIELRAIEESLRHLAEQVLSGTAVQFRPWQEPRLRTALRMQLGDDPRPAALGGVYDPSGLLPEGVHVASITIYLEPWASARSGRTIDLAEGPPFPHSGRL